MSARPRPSSSLPKPPTTLDPTCMISDTAVLTGLHHIIIGANAVLHPRCRISSTHGPVTIGPGCIVCERAVVGLQQEPADDEATDSNAAADTSETVDSNQVVLEPNVSIEPAALVEARTVGTGTLLEAGCKVGPGAVIGAHCRVTPLCSVPAGGRLEDFTVVYGENRRRRERPGLEKYREASHAMELEVLRKLVPSNLAKWQTAG